MWFEVVSLALAPGPTYLNQLEVFGFVVTWADSSVDMSPLVMLFQVDSSRMARYVLSQSSSLVTW